MKIAIATFADLPSPPVKGGAVETLIDIICQINEKKKKIDIDLFSIADKNAEIKAAEYHQTEFVYYQKYYSKKINVKSIAWKLFKKSIPDKTMSGITSLINKEDYDFVIITSINNEMEYIFRKIHSKVIWYLHGDPLSVLSTDAIERITNQCYSVITVSDFVKSRVKSAAPGCRAVTVRNCTDLIPIPDKEVTVVKQKIRNKAEIGMKDKLFVYIGRIIPIKGVYELVRAFVSADMQNAKLLIVGAPSNRGEEIYLEKIKEIANSNVKYWGYADHDKLNELYCAADCVVAPSICQEAAPLIALEVSVCRRRLIATNIGGIPEYIDKNGLLVNYDEKFVENLAKELISVNAVDDCEICSEIVSNQMESYYDDFYNALQIFDEEKNNHVKIDKYN